jgi:hypothetical protein
VLEGAGGQLQDGVELVAEERLVGGGGEPAGRGDVVAAAAEVFGEEDGSASPARVNQLPATRWAARASASGSIA